MASSSSMFTPKEPHFFSVILQDTANMRENKLLIPRRFVRKYGSGVSNPVKISVPGGSTWELEWSKSDDGNVWFKNGWQEFRHFYSISHGYFLVFMYKGDSQFSVLIFDKSTSEIDYPVKSIYDVVNNQDGRKHEEPRKEEETDDGDDSSFCEMLEDYSSRQKKQKYSQVQNNTPHSAENSRVTWRKGRVKADKNAKALERVTCESDNPFVKLVIQKSHINPSSNKLCLPLRFSEFFPRSEGDGVATLCASNGKSWDVTYCFDNWISRIRLQNGWREFARDNKLHVGDVCIFELINRIKLTFKVFISKDVANRGPHLSEGKCKQVVHKNLARIIEDSPPNVVVHGPLEHANKFSSNNPLFKFVMRHGYHSYMHIPANFGKHMKLLEKTVTLQVENRYWLVQFHKSLGRICGGWSTFTRDNFLEDGDICFFELIKKKMVVLKVYIFKKIK